MLLAGGKRESLVHCLNILYICFPHKAMKKVYVEKNRMSKLPHSGLLAQQGHSD